MRRLRGSRGFVSLIAVAGLLGTSIAVLVGTGAKVGNVPILDGFTWLVSSEKGELTQVNGATGKAELRFRLKGAAGHDLQVLQNGKDLLFKDATTGDVGSIDLSSFKVSGQTDYGRSGIRILLGKGKAAVVNASSGVVQQVDRTTTKPKGPKLALGGPLSPGGFDAQDRVWVVQPSSGDLVGVDFPAKGAKVAKRFSVGDPSPSMVVSISAGKPVVVDPANGYLRRVDGDHLGGVEQLGVRATDALVPTEVEDGTLPIVVPSRDQLVLVGSEGRPVTVPLQSGSAHLGAPVRFQGKTYVPDFDAGQVIEVETDGTILRRIDVPGGQGGFDLFLDDDQLWADPPAGSEASAITKHGQILLVKKYDDQAPIIGDPSSLLPNDVPSPSPVPQPATTPAPSPSKPSVGSASPSLGTGGLPGPGPGGGLPPPTTSPAPTVPPTTTPPTSIPPTRPPSTSPASTAPTTAPPTSPKPLVPGAPGTPSLTLASDGNNGVAASLTWTPPADDGGSSITGYEVDTGDGTAVPTDTTSYTLALEDGRDYHFKVRAKNEIGAGSWSGEVAQSGVGAPDISALTATSGAYGKISAGISIDWKGSKMSTCTVSLVDSNGQPSQEKGCSSTVLFDVSTFGDYYFSVTATNEYSQSSTKSSAPVHVRYPSHYYLYTNGGSPNLNQNVNMRTGPSQGAQSGGLLTPGSAVSIVCQVQGQMVNWGKDSNIWDQLDNGLYISDLFVTTPGVGVFSPGIDTC